MKLKLIASSVMLAGALMASGTASATVLWDWNGSVQDWIDNGTMINNASSYTKGTVTTSATLTGDMAFAFGGFGGSYTDLTALATHVELQELLVGGVNLINVVFTPQGNSPSVLSDGHSLFYTETAQGTNLITSASLDATVASSVETIAASLPSASLSLLYKNGTRDPATGEYYFPGVSSVTVTDTYNANGGSISSVANQININNSNVPEPFTMSLLGLGLAAFGFSRRRTLLAAENLSA